MKTLKEKIEVMQAAFDGKEIEFRIKEKWYPMPESEFDTAWNWEGIDYRIKPEPIDLQKEVDFLKEKLEKVYEAGEWGIFHVGAANYSSREDAAHAKLQEAMYGEVIE